MITPAYSATATERVLPRLALDFTTASLDARVTVARALNTATRVNGNGFIETVNADLPRFDYTLNTGGSCKGLLIEESRINILRESVTMAGSSWLTSGSGGGSAPVPTTNAGTSPDGTGNATKIVFSAPVSGDISSYYQTSFASSAGSYTGSFYVKAFAAGDVGKIIGFRHVASGAYQLVTLTANWTRVEKTETQAGSNFELILRPALGTSSGTVSVLVYGGQLEVGAFATSYIPNIATGTTTRNADVVSMTGTNFSSWWNSTAGTFFTSYQTLVNSSISAARGILTYDSSGNKLVTYIGGGGTTASTYDGSSIVAATGSAVATASKTVMAYSSAGRAIATNGGTVATGSAPSAGFLTATLLNIGALNVSTTGQINGYIKAVRYWPQRLTNAEIQAFSK